MTSRLPSHGTGWTETEVLMDVIELYDAWDGSGSPDFSALQRRLREQFNDNELRTLETAVETLAKFIDDELSRRIVEKEQTAESQLG